MTDIVRMLKSCAEYVSGGDILDVAALVSEAAEEIRNLRHTCDGLLAERDMAREALRRVMECYVEINPNNYGHDDVCELYEAFGEAYDIADAALRSHEAQQ